MKKVLSLFLLFYLLATMPNASASESSNVFISKPRIAVVLTGDQNILMEKRITEEIDKKIKKEFPENEYEVKEDKKIFKIY